MPPVVRTPRFVLKLIISVLLLAAAFLYARNCQPHAITGFILTDTSGTKTLVNRPIAHFLSKREFSSFDVDLVVERKWVQSTTLRMMPDDCLERITVNDTPVELEAKDDELCHPRVITVDLSPYMQAGRNKVALAFIDKGGWYGVTMRFVNSGRDTLIILSLALAALLAWVPRALVLPITDTSRYHRHLTLLLLAAPLIIYLKSIYFTSHFSGDYGNFLRHWMQHIKHHGVSVAFGKPFSDYNVLYLYLLALGDMLMPTWHSMHVVKTISTAGEFIAAYFIFRIVALKYGAQSLLPFMAALLVFVLPSVLVNASIIGQCDIFYTSFLLATFYALRTGRPAVAMLYFGIAYSFKLQAIFFAPYLLILFLRGELKFRYLWIAPATYLALLIPAWWAGWPGIHLLSIYWKQFNTYGPYGNAGNFFTVLGRSFDFESRWVLRNTAPLGVLLAVSISLKFILDSWRVKRPLAPLDHLLLITFFLALAPFTLPKMLDRYFFPVDLFTLALAFYQPRYIWLAIVFNFSSTLMCPDWNSSLWRDLGWSYGWGRMYTSVALHTIGVVALGRICYVRMWKANYSSPVKRAAADRALHPGRGRKRKR